jgi:addiction module HigA family antidote
MTRIPTHRPPTHPGEALREDFLPDAGLSQSEAARRLRMSFRRLNEIINERRAVTPDTALRLAKLFSQTPDFWMNLQMRWELYHALHSKSARDLAQIKPIAAA